MTRWNVTEDKVQDVAYAVRQRAMASGRRHEVYVRDNGSVQITLQGKSERRHAMPDHWLVGTYDRQASTADIAEDLAERVRELNA